ncbi:hypothetical protein DL771_002362 [Monosporascus sp. 5C6A]|nr:hypothetical protein DL771_002362 [Monosporascus sp. 5C6A]
MTRSTMISASRNASQLRSRLVYSPYNYRTVMGYSGIALPLLHKWQQEKVLREKAEELLKDDGDYIRAIYDGDHDEDAGLYPELLEKWDP